MKVEGVVLNRLAWQLGTTDVERILRLVYAYQLIKRIYNYVKTYSSIADLLGNAAFQVDGPSPLWDSLSDYLSRNRIVGTLRRPTDAFFRSPATLPIVYFSCTEKEDGISTHSLDEIRALPIPGAERLNGFSA